MKKTLLEKFETRYKINEVTGCWEWTSYGRSNYGFITIVLNGKPKSLQAHRISYELFVGPIPEGLLVRHTCDNPPCVNPEHLLTGTTTDNAQDCISRGRNAQAKKTHCRNGHEYNLENTLNYIYSTYKERKCRICHNSHSRASYFKKYMTQ